VGAKSTLFGRTTLNGDLYDIDWRGIQLQQLSPSGLNFTANAGRAWIHGVDFQITSQLSDATEVGANLDYHRSRLTEVNNGVNGVVGDELPGSSRLSSYLYGKYKFNLGRIAKGFLRVDYSYSSKAYSDLDNATSLHYGNVASIDAQTGLHLNSLELLLFCRNLADARNRVNAFELVGEPAQVLQTTRTIGLTARWNY
jgi:iron complex outermembrane receptor protein